LPTPASAQVPAAQAALRDCLAHRSETPTQPLLQQCPQVREALRQLGDAPLLSEGWEQHLNARALQGLLDLSQRYQASPTRAGPSPSLLAPILQQLRDASSPRSWWRELEDRLRQWLAARNANNAAWLGQLLSAVPLLLVRGFFYVTLAAVVLMALWIVWRELRASGLLERRHRAADASGIPDASPASAAAEPSFAEVQAAPVGQRASVLLRLLLHAMRRTGRVRGEQMFSCRELAERALFDSPEQRRRFAVIALWAERERYGTNPGSDAAFAPPPPPAGVATPLLQAGKELYAQLLQPVASAGTSVP
jgi:hypothetical protein